MTTRTCRRTWLTTLFGIGSLLLAADSCAASPMPGGQPLRDHAAGYEMTVLIDGAPAATYEYGGGTYVLGQLGARYTLRVANHSGRRVEAVVSVDVAAVALGLKKKLPPFRVIGAVVGSRFVTPLVSSTRNVAPGPTVSPEVPRIEPLRVWLESSSSRLARPKSVILGVPSAVRRMLAGFRSRWTMPCRWAKSIARASVSTWAAVCSGGRGVPR